MSPAARTNAQIAAETKTDTPAPTTTPPAAATTTTAVSDFPVAMTEAARIAHELQPHLLVMSTEHPDPLIAALAGAVFSLATCTEAIARANA